MATANPFANVGLSQFGQDFNNLGGKSILDDPIDGFKKVFLAKAIQATGLQGLLNGGNGAAVPPNAISPTPVAPTSAAVAPTPVAVAPNVSSSNPAFNPYAEFPENEDHPEIANTLLTTLF